MRTSRFVCRWWLPAAAILPGCFAAAADESEAWQQEVEQTLQTEYDLVRMEDTDLWLVRREYRLRADLESLDELQEEVVKWEEAVARNTRDASMGRQMLPAIIAALNKELRATRQKDTEWYKMRLGQRKLQQSQLAAANNPGNVARFREDVQSLIAARNRLALTVLRIDRTWPDVKAAYEQLRENAEVEELLKQLGEGHRLGPGHEDYEKRVREATGEARALVFTNEIPAYLLGDTIRISAILNECMPIDCTWSNAFRVSTIEEDRRRGRGKPKGKQRPAGRPLNRPVILRYMADAAGIVVSPDAEQFVLDRPDNAPRVPGVRSARATVRLGGCLLEDIDVYVLPPEAAAVGAILGNAALKGYAAEEEMLKLRLIVKPTGSAVEE